jgi:hypothetical protein
VDVPIREGDATSEILSQATDMKAEIPKESIRASLQSAGHAAASSSIHGDGRQGEHASPIRPYDARVLR